MMNSNSSMVMLLCFVFVYIYPSVGTSYSEDEDIIYTNIAFSDYFDEFNTDSHYDSGLIFTRVRGPLYNKVFINETLNVFFENGFVPAEDFKTPVTLNHPGVGILDFDNDGDLDIFVTNGRGAAHSLFSNQLIENSGYFGEFIDVGNTSGFGDSTSILQEGSGVCFGDVNNDGFSDIMVLGRNDINLLYLNNGDSSFSVLLNSGIDNINKTYNSSSCTFGDINNDGYIDLFIGNSVNTEDATTIIRQLFVPSNPSLPFSLNEPNELYLNMFDSNTGIVSFEDVSDRVSGTSFPNPANNGESGITWAVIMADINNDGLIDMIEANDQLGPSFDGPPNGPFFTQRRGINQVWFNDESNPGYFINKYILFVGSWMGISTGDLNCDDSLDIFLTNVGTYFVDAPEPGVSGKNLATKWFFNNNEENISNFEFVNDGESELFDFNFISPFGWGCAMYDYDIDGDLDILVHGGLDGALALAATNAGTLWRNDGDGCFNDSDVNVVSPESIFGIDPNCDGNGSSIPGCTYHTKRNVRGVSIGDLNDDGLYDIVTTSDFVYSEDFELLRYNQVNVTSPFDNVVKNGDILYNSSFWLELLFSENENGDFVWNGKETLEGDLFVEIAQIQNKNKNKNKFKNKSFKLLLKGSKGLLTNGNVNRDGIGAIITVDVKNSDKRTTVPITGGESHLSQHSFEKVFGLGKKNKGDVIIKWPKGNGQGSGYNVNKLDDVKKNEKLTLYELPCDYESRYDNFNEYKTCVTDSLNQLYYQPLSQNKLQKRICKSMGISTSQCNSLLY